MACKITGNFTPLNLFYPPLTYRLRRLVTLKDIGHPSCQINGHLVYDCIARAFGRASGHATDIPSRIPVKTTDNKILFLFNFLVKLFLFNVYFFLVYFIYFYLKTPSFSSVRKSRVQVMTVIAIRLYFASSSLIFLQLFLQHLFFAFISSTFSLHLISLP